VPRLPGPAEGLIPVCDSDEGSSVPDEEGPTPGDLAVIEREWPLVEAELSLVDAEISMVYAAERGEPSPLDWRRLRRAEARVLRRAGALACGLAAHATPGSLTCGSSWTWRAEP